MGQRRGWSTVNAGGTRVPRGACVRCVRVRKCGVAVHLKRYSVDLDPGDQAKADCLGLQVFFVSREQCEALLELSFHFLKVDDLRSVRAKNIGSRSAVIEI